MYEKDDERLIRVLESLYDGASLKDVMLAMSIEATLQNITLVREHLESFVNRGIASRATELQGVVEYFLK